MGAKIVLVARMIEGLPVNQRQIDGYVKTNQLCEAHRVKTGERKDPSEWLSNKSSKAVIEKLSAVTGIPVTALTEVKQGGKYQGTWIHPRLAVRFAMWLSEDFSLQVEDWIHEWLSTAHNPIQLEADADRVSMRDEVKDKKRLELTGQVKAFLVKAGVYDPKSKETGIFFGRVHNEVNLVLTAEKAASMRARLELHLGKKVSESELLRDYFPMIDLANYAALCQASANNMAGGMHPIEAVRLAARQVLPLDYVPKPIDFTERIVLVRRRLEQRDQLHLASA